MTRLKLWRMTAGQSQRDAATRLGVSLASYQLLESGRLSASRDQQTKLRKVFGSRAGSMLETVPDDVLEAAGAVL